MALFSSSTAWTGFRCGGSRSPCRSARSCSWVHRERLPVVLDRQEIPIRVEVEVPIPISACRFSGPSGGSPCNSRCPRRRSAGSPPPPPPGGRLLLLAPEIERTAAKDNRSANRGRMPLLFITRSPREDLRTRSATASRCDRTWEQPRREPLRRRAGGRIGAAPSTRAGSRAPASRSRHPPEGGCRRPASAGPPAPPRRPASSSSRFASASSSHGNARRRANRQVEEPRWYGRPNGSLAYIRRRRAVPFRGEPADGVTDPPDPPPLVASEGGEPLLLREDTPSHEGGHSRFSRRNYKECPPLPGMSPLRNDTVGEGADPAHLDGHDVPTRSDPTPGGVPVAITSPGNSVIKEEMYSTIRYTDAIISRVLPSWRTSPFTRQRTGASAGSKSVTIHGPSGANVSNPLERANCTSFHLEVARGHVVDAGVPRMCAAASFSFTFFATRPITTASSAS